MTISTKMFRVILSQSYGPLQGFVVGQWGEGSKDLHTFVQTCAEAKVAHLVRASGRQESEHLFGMVVGQFRRLLSTTGVDDFIGGRE